MEVGSPSPIPIYSPKSKLHQRKKTLKFAPKVKVHPIDHVKDFDQSTIDSVWYSSSELGEIKQECISTIQMMINGELIDEDDGISLRGLEKYLPENAGKYTADKKKARLAVLEEQEMQWEEGSNDPEWISMIYQEATRESIVAACIRAIEVETELKFH